MRLMNDRFLARFAKRLIVLLPLLTLMSVQTLLAQEETKPDLLTFGATVTAGSTDVHSGPDLGFSVNSNVSNGTQGEVMARSYDNRYTFFSSKSGTGWVPSGTLSVDGNINRLPIWRFGMKGWEYQATGNINVDAANMRTGADLGYNVLTTANRDLPVDILAKSPDSDWVFIRSEKITGWTERANVGSANDLVYLPVWTNKMRGAEFDESKSSRTIFLQSNTPVRHAFNAESPVRGYVAKQATVNPFAKSPNGQWVFVVENGGNGWVEVSEVNLSKSLDSLPVWTNTIPFN